MNAPFINKHDPIVEKLVELILEGRYRHVYSSPIARPLVGGVCVQISNVDFLICDEGQWILGLALNSIDESEGLDVMVSRARLAEVADVVDPQSTTIPLLTLLNAVVAVMERDIKAGVPL